MVHQLVHNSAHVLDESITIPTDINMERCFECASAGDFEDDSAQEDDFSDDEQMHTWRTLLDTYPSLLLESSVPSEASLLP